MRLADIRAQLRFRLQEPQSTGRFSDAELDSYINRGQAEVADQLEPLVKVTSLSFGAGVATQPLPDNLLRIHRASIGGTALRTTDPLALDATSTTWEGATGTPTHYFIQGNDLRLYPIPDSPVTVDVTHSYLPEDLVDDTDELSLPDNLLRIHRASIGGTALRTTDPLALDATSTTWEGATGTPTHYFIQGNDLRLYPIPDSPVTVDVTHSYLPEDLVDDTDELSLP